MLSDSKNNKRLRLFFLAGAEEQRPSPSSQTGGGGGAIGTCLGLYSMCGLMGLRAQRRRSQGS